MLCKKLKNCSQWVQILSDESITFQIIDTDERFFGWVHQAIGYLEAQQAGKKLQSIIGLQDTFWNINSSAWAVWAVRAVKEKKWIFQLFVGK